MTDFPSSPVSATADDLRAVYDAFCVSEPDAKWMSPTVCMIHAILNRYDVVPNGTHGLAQRPRSPEEAEIDAWIESIGRIAPQIRQNILDAAARYDQCKDSRPLVYTMRHDDPLTVGDLRSIAIALSDTSTLQSAPAIAAPQNSAERDPSVTPDYAGAEQRLHEFVGWVDSWVSKPVGSYSVSALDGLFGMTRDKIAALSITSPVREGQ